MLSGKELVRLAKEAHREHPEAFEALMEYERTGKLLKPNPKTRANFTLDAKLLQQFRSYCQRHGYKMSAVLEKSIEAFLQSTRKQTER